MMTYSLRKSRLRKTTQVSGFTLIEVLITVVILSIGLLGMAGIQIQGLRGTTSSTVRSQATILANDIAERIHMNAGGVFIIQNNGDPAPTNQQYSDVDTSAITCGEQIPNFCSVTPGNSVVVPCATPQQMAAFDIYDFACGLNDDAGVNNLLPNGFATISCNAAGCPIGTPVTININWEETSTNQDDNGATITKTVSMVVIP